MRFSKGISAIFRLVMPGLSLLVGTLVAATLLAATSLSLSTQSATQFKAPEVLRTVSASPLAESSNPNSLARTGQTRDPVAWTTRSLNFPATQVYVSLRAQAGGILPSAPNGVTGQTAMSVLFLSFFLGTVTLLTWRQSRRDHSSPRRIGRRA